MKKLFYILGIIVAPAFFFTSHAGAVSDVVITITQDTYAVNSLICSNDTSDNIALCSDFNYIKFDYQLDFATNVGIQARRLSPTTYTSVFTLSGATNQIITEISDDIYKMRIGGASNLPANFTITITLSENSPSICPVCPAPPPCPDCSDPAIVQLFKSGFWGVATALVSVIVPILALFLVFRLVHDLFWGKG